MTLLPISGTSDLEKDLLVIERENARCDLVPWLEEIFFFFCNEMLQESFWEMSSLQVEEKA